ncbi:mechanosensitive ion channel family protein [Plantibacter sp. M259]|uniref:mechanosensitive ion channel family protein n=1 Tax=Plantibacter sp. M259 TaxID=2583822 RepID=UPI002104EBB6|nr:mechanosensitive ion channel family protein [Plantibacter sp. M259]
MFVWQSWWGVAAAAGIALIAALVVIVIVSVSFRMAARRSDWPGALAGSARHPFRALVVLVAVWPAVAATLPDETTRGFIDQTFRIAVIAAATWLVAALLAFVIGLGQARYRIDVPNNKVARRMQTQLALVRRLAIAVVVIVGVASILLTFPGVQGVGASVLASAGVVSIVAGLAAQSVLGNVFAGIQLAFSDAIRVDDVVIVEGSGAGSRRSPSPTSSSASGTIAAWCSRPPTSPPRPSRTGRGTRASCSGRSSSTSTGG